MRGRAGPLEMSREGQGPAEADSRGPKGFRCAGRHRDHLRPVQGAPGAGGVQGRDRDLLRALHRDSGAGGV